MNNSNLPRIMSFTFHEVTDDPSTSGFQRASALPYTHSRLGFARYLEEIVNSDLTPSLVHETELHTKARSLMLTFDDGGSSSMYIADALEEMGWRGHFFIVSSLTNTKCFMTDMEILDLHNRGHVIGIHSHTHPPRFAALPYSEMLMEWRVSRELVENIIGSKILCASIPGGSISSSVLESARESDIDFLFTSEPVTSPWKTGEMVCLGRICPKANTNPRRISRLLDFRGLFREKCIHQIKCQVRKIYRPI